MSMYGGMGCPTFGAAHPTYGPAMGSSGLQYLVGPRGFDGGIHNSPFVEGRAKEPFSAPGTYNPFKFARPWKRRINLLSIVQILALLFLVFAMTVYLYGFRVHYTAPVWCSLWLAFCMVLCLVFLVKGVLIWRKQKQEILTVLWYMMDDHTWYLFLAAAVFGSALVGYLVGNIIYDAYSLPYYTLSQLHSYTDVDPVKGGKGYMDTGAIDFRNGSFVDTTHGVGYKDSDVYCVAPVKWGNDTVANNDFWAVGVNCCNGFPGDFNCFEDRTDVLARGGMRVLDDDEIRHYKLAVMQAGQEWGRASPNPIFLSWMRDPAKKIRAYYDDATWTWRASILVFVVFEFAIVAIMALHFWRQRSWG